MRRTSPEQLTFADLERRNSAGTDRLLDTISDLLDGVPRATELVRRDLESGLTKPATGRRGLGPETVLRSMILWRIKDYSYRELGDRIADGYELRRFVRLRGYTVPKHNAFQRAFNRLSADTLKEIIDLFAGAAKEQGLDDGSEVRIDGSVVETDIHFPTDASLLWDVVRILTRLVRRLGEDAPQLLEGFHDRTRRSKKLFYRIQRPSHKSARAKTDTMYRELIGLATEVVDASALVADRAKAVVCVDMLDQARAEALRHEVEQYVELGKKVIDQARRRIVEGEKVPAGEKIVSIFEPHTDIIVRNKKRKPVEFGHKLVIAETKAGFIFHHDVQDGNPSEKPWVEETLSHHDKVYGKPPKVLAADRGFYSASNIALCKKAGVKIEAIPYRGGRRPAERTEHETTAEYKKAQRFRSGVEGRLSGLMRGRGLHRCNLEGRKRFDLFVAAGILTSNLMCLAEIAMKKAKENEADESAAAA